MTLMYYLGWRQISTIRLPCLYKMTVRQVYVQNRLSSSIQSTDGTKFWKQPASSSQTTSCTLPNYTLLLNYSLFLSNKKHKRTLTTLLNKDARTLFFSRMTFSSTLYIFSVGNNERRIMVQSSDWGGSCRDQRNRHQRYENADCLYARDALS